MKTYLVFIIQAYQTETPEGRLIDNVELQLIAKDFKKAEKRAKEIIKKKFYRLAMVIEKGE